MKVSLLLSVVGLIAVIGCSASKTEKPADEAEEDSADVVSESSESEPSAKKETSDSAASPAGDPASSGAASTAPKSGAPAPPATASPGGANPAPAKPAATDDSCYARCLATKGQRVNVFDACMTKCGDGVEACVDACWTASGCAANENECQQAYRTCDAQCPDA